MPRPYLVQTLMAKAAQDERVFGGLLALGDMPVEALGFAAQQAVEKLLKAAIEAVGLEAPHIHDIAVLLDLARDSGVPVPSAFDHASQLTLFAAHFRYAVLPGELDASLDMVATRQLIRDLRAWVEEFVRTREQPEESG